MQLPEVSRVQLLREEDSHFLDNLLLGPPMSTERGGESATAREPRLEGESQPKLWANMQVGACWALQMGMAGACQG